LIYILIIRRSFLRTAGKIWRSGSSIFGAATHSSGQLLFPRGQGRTFYHDDAVTACLAGKTRPGTFYFGLVNIVFLGTFFTNDQHALPPVDGTGFNPRTQHLFDIGCSLVSVKLIL